jgi:hypothetical protein
MSLSGPLCMQRMRMQWAGSASRQQNLQQLQLTLCWDYHGDGISYLRYAVIRAPVVHVHAFSSMCSSWHWCCVICGPRATHGTVYTARTCLAPGGDATLLFASSLTVATCCTHVPACLLLPAAAVQLVITDASWPLRGAFLDTLSRCLDNLQCRAPWYPGSAGRIAAFKQRFPSAQVLGRAVPSKGQAQGHIAAEPWQLATGAAVLSCCA